MFNVTCIFPPDTLYTDQLVMTTPVNLTKTGPLTIFWWHFFLFPVISSGPELPAATETEIELRWLWLQVMSPPDSTSSPLLVPFNIHDKACSCLHSEATLTSPGLSYHHQNSSKRYAWMLSLFIYTCLVSTDIIIYSQWDLFWVKWLQSHY